MAGYAVILVVEAAQIQIANRLLWECRNVTPDKNTGSWNRLRNDCNAACAML